MEIIDFCGKKKQQDSGSVDEDFSVIEIEKTHWKFAMDEQTAAIRGLARTVQYLWLAVLALLAINIFLVAKQWLMA